MTCYEAIDVMGEAAEDRLDVALQPGFAAHMDDCEPCGTYFQQLQISRQGLRRLRRRGQSIPDHDRLLREFRSNLGRKEE